MRMRDRGGLTLIELMVVAGILAIVGAIMWSNYAEASTRSKISRVKADFRTVFTVIEAYHIDHNKYVPDVPGGGNWVEDIRPFAMLTTPIAYMSTIPYSPFDMKYARLGGNYAFWGNDSVTSKDMGLYYHVISTGPDGQIDLYFDTLVPELVVNQADAFKNKLYNPTNGTMSRGDLHLSNRGLSF